MRSGLVLLMFTVVAGIFALFSRVGDGHELLSLDLLDVRSAETTGDGRLLLQVRGTGLGGDTQFSLVRAFGNPRLVRGRLQLFHTVEGMAARNDHLFLAGNRDGLVVCDISRPDRPEVVGSLRLPGRVWRVHLWGDLVLALTIKHGLHLVDVADPLQPRLVRTLSLPGYLYDITANEHFAYVAAFREGVHVLRLDGDTGVQLVGTVPSRDRARGLALSRDLLVVADSSRGLSVFRGAESGMLQLTGKVELPDVVQQLLFLGEGRLVARGHKHLFVVDLQAGQDPRVHIYRNQVNSGGGLVVLDKTLFWGGQKGLFSARIDVEGRLIDPGMVVLSHGVRSMFPAAGRLYVADQGKGLEVFDPQVSMRLTDQGIFRPGSRSRDMVVHNGRIYLTGYDFDLQIVEPDDRGRFRSLGKMVERWQVFAAAARERHVYLGTGDRALVILEADGELSVKRRLTLPGKPIAMAVAGDYLLVAASEAGLLCFDLSDPDAPVMKGALPVLYSAVSLALDGTRVFLADMNGGVHLVRIGQGGELTEQRRVEVYRGAYDLAFAGGRLYVVNGRGKVRVFAVDRRGELHSRGELQLPGLAEEVEGDATQLLVRGRTNRLYRYHLYGQGDERLPVDPLLLAKDAVSVRLQQQKLIVVRSGGRIAIYSSAAVDRPKLTAELEDPDLGSEALLVGDNVLVYDQKHYVAFWPLARRNLSGLVLGGRGKTIDAEGDLVVIGSLDSLRVIDAVDPRQPVELARLSLGGSVVSVRLLQGLCYAYVRNQGVVIVDLRRPDRPKSRGRIAIEDPFGWVDVDGNRAVVATKNSGFYSVDVRDPDRPIVLDHLVLPVPLNRFSQVVDAVRGGSYVYAADHSNGLLVLRESGAGKLKIVNSFQTGGIPYSLFLRQGKLYLADWKKSIFVFSVDNPRQPVLLAHYPGTSGCRRVWVGSGKILVLDDQMQALYYLPEHVPGRIRQVSPALATLSFTLPRQSGQYQLFASGSRGQDALPVIEVFTDGRVRLPEF
ncbi:hypothetical protein EDC39_105172 [Geothermobacter ehrlichii]|uniref:Uncharacterized protein n=1 Tax=Geothermobacter ehrlichii TaxID=213224 RepID=A0A5D3WLG1_9BACT|nr:hypothetical protein [Geothermobacter ehrlichii]TYO98803.1 hypothetical protein EDC39_105172 [Geothermobacter ehrlichii]